MTIEIHSPEVEALLQARMQSGHVANPEDLLREILRVPLRQEAQTGADWIAAMRACPYPEVEIVPQAVASSVVRDVSL